MAAMSEFRCPVCRKPSRPAEPGFPFCSKRCRLIDLGAWLDERYRVSRPLRADDLDPEAFGDLPPSSDVPMGEAPQDRRA